MNAELDMNSNRVLNLPEPIADAEPVRLIDLQQAQIPGADVFGLVKTDLSNLTGTTFANKAFPVVTNGINRSLSDRFGEVINVKDIGPINGVDDFTTLDTCRQLAEASGRPVFVPPDTECVIGDNFLQSFAPIEWVGGSQNTSVITRTGNRNLPVIYFNNGSAGDYRVSDLTIRTTQSTDPTNSSFNSAVCATNVSNVVVENVSVDATTKGFYMGIVFDGVQVGRGTNLDVRKAFNRGIYLYQNCLDMEINGAYVDLRDSGGTARGSYCLNTNPAGTTTPKRLVLRGLRLRGFTAHGIGISERYEDILLGDFEVDCTGGGLNTGVLLQFANTFRGRKALVSDGRITGGQFGLQANACDDFEIANVHTIGASVAGHYILDSTKWTITGGSSSYCTSQGMLISGQTAASCRDGIVNGHRINGCTGYGAQVIAGVAGGTSEVVFMGGSFSDNGNNGIVASANTDRINVIGSIAKRNGATNISLLGTNSTTANTLTT